MNIHRNRLVQFNTIISIVFFCISLFLSFKSINANITNSESVILQIGVSGILFFIAAITFIQYQFFKESTYIYYFLYIVVNIMYFIVMSSFDIKDKTLLPVWFERLRYFLPTPLLIISYSLYTIFAINFLNVKTKDAFAYKWLSFFSKFYFVLLGIAFITYFFPAQQNIVSIIRPILLIICMPIGLISIVIVFIRVKNNITKILCIGSMFFLIGSILGFVYAGKAIPFITNSFPFNKWIFYTEVGTILEIIMFSSSFAYRNKLIADEERTANEKLLHIRDEIARDLHDDIGASLSNINILSELAKRNAGNTFKVNEYLEKAGEDIQHVSESLNDIVWNINPQYDDFVNLLNRMRRYAADMMEGKNISYTIHFPDNLNDIKLQMDKRRNFFLIFKEAINNLVKYSQAKNATIDLIKHHKNLELTIIDDGKGFDIATIEKGNGLKNMEQRASQCNANLIIESKINAGTHISLIIAI